jgi:hypothetical protein
MKKLLAPLILAALGFASPAAANHIFNLDVPFPTRGDCEAERAQLSIEDWDSLLIRFPKLFTSQGEVASFLTRAFSCEFDPQGGQWYIVDHRTEVLASPWFQRRLR